MEIYQLTFSTLSLPFSRIEEIKPHPISWVWAHMTWVKCPIIPAACVSCVSVEKWFAASSVMYLTWKLYLNSLPTTTHSFKRYWISCINVSRAIQLPQHTTCQPYGRQQHFLVQFCVCFAMHSFDRRRETCLYVCCGREDLRIDQPNCKEQRTASIYIVVNNTQFEYDCKNLLRRSKSTTVVQLLPDHHSNGFFSY